MNDVLCELMLNGFMIYAKNGKFFVKKESVPTNKKIIEEIEYDNYEDAIGSAVEILKKPGKIFWSAIARYNRGLGIEYKNLPDFEAETFEKAICLAEEIAKKTIGGPRTVISEVKVHIKN
jgi:hypothetical protein